MTENDSSSGKTGRKKSTPPPIRLKWVLIPLFSALTGYSENAIRCKIRDGVWVEGIHFQRAQDGRITMNLEAYYQWVEGLA